MSSFDVLKPVCPNGATIDSSAEGGDTVASSALRQWLAVLSVAVGAFAFVTSEFLPVGILTGMASDLGVSHGTAGQMVTMPGILGALAAPGLTILVGRLDRRIVLWLLTSLLVVSNLIVALAPNFEVLLAGRLLLGLGIGGFWSFAISLSTRLVPEAMVERATAVTLAGVSLGTICGVPAGSLIADAFGWRAVFALAASLAVVVLVFQTLYLPRLPALAAIRPSDLPKLFLIPRARVGFLIVLLLITGHFGAYTYLRPLLEEVARFDTVMITVALVAYGLIGLAGNFLGSLVVAKSPRMGLFGAALLLGLTLVATAAFGSDPTAAMLLVGLWGFAFGAVPVSVQTWMFKSAPHALEPISALTVTTFQVSIALGSFVGGQVVDGLGVPGTMLFGGVLALLAASVAGLLAGERRVRLAA